MSKEPFDAAKVDKAILALLALTMHSTPGGTRAWKSHDWDALNRLYQKGYIENPVNKNKSVVMTKKGVKHAQELFNRYFGNRNSTASEPKELREDATDTSAIRLCGGCGQAIPAARLRSMPGAQFCVACGEKYEKTHDTRPRIDEGLAGSREDHKRMRGKQWGDMVQRSRGK